MFKLLVLCLGLVVPSMGALPFIIGGTKVSKMSDHPHQCSLQVFDDHNCGASIISEDWLVTAAHCVGLPASWMSVKCGNLKHSAGTKHTLSTIEVHEKYEEGPGTFPNDIAVIKVSSSMDLSGDDMKAIVLATTEDQVGKECYITGWGYTKTGGGGRIPDDLMVAKINVYTNTECQNEWEGIGDIVAGHVCIGDSDAGRGSCNGDSGGPLVCKVGDSFQLVGATSWGINGCYTNFPSVYSRISYFREWIRGKTGV